MQRLQPVIVGTDVNAYNVARAFHMVTGESSKVFGKAALLMVAHSRICDVEVVSGFEDDRVFVETLSSYASENPDTQLVLFAASEEYVYRILKNRAALEGGYFIPYADADLGLNLSYKPFFYRACDEAGLRYPRTEVIPNAQLRTYETQMDFPLVVKPSESSEFFNLRFEGKEKAYIASDEGELRRILRAIAAAGYSRDMLLQQFIAGPVTNEYVMNVYSDSAGKVRQMSLGRILIDDPDPELRGNYVAICSPPDSFNSQLLYSRVRTFLENIGFTGLSNFDFKVNENDGEIYCFEMNLRQGRSSFFSVMSGANFLEPIIADVTQEPESAYAGTGVEYGADPFVWLNCTNSGFFSILQKYHRAEEAMVPANANMGNTLQYADDKSLRRDIAVRKYMRNNDARVTACLESKSRAGSSVR